MIRLNSVIICVVAGVMVSCSPKIASNMIHSYPPQESYEDVVMFKEKEPLPVDAEWMGDIVVKGKANYDKMAEMTRLRAWESGGKYVKIKEYASQGARADVHVMKSDVYRADTVQHKAVPITTYSNNNANNNPASVNAPYEIRKSGYVNDLNTTSSTPATLDVPFFTSPNSLRMLAGYGRRVGKINPRLNEFEKMHLKRMLGGVMLGADYVRYFNSSRTCGFGFRYQMIHGHSEDYCTMTFDDGSPSLEGLLVDNVNISYVGPIYSKRKATRDGKNYVMYDVGFGLLLYRENSAIAGKSSNTKGVTTGITLNFNYSHMLSDKLSLGADLSLTSGTLTKYTVNSYYGQTVTVGYEDENDWIGLMHLGICAQLIYTF